MGIREWWAGDPAERYWMEITDRPDIGSDLKAPQRKDNGDEFWSYSLVTHLDHGDVVFHYDKNRQEIASWSRVAGGWWEEDIIWAAHGLTARDAAIQPYQRPGWKAGLTDHADIREPVTLADIRARRADVLKLEATLEQMHGSPLYLPFTRYADSLRPQQGYLTKLPLAFIRMFPGLEDAANAALATSPSPTPTAIPDVSAVGSTYRPADEYVAVSTRDPMFPDPALIERGTRGHAKSQNLLASRLAEIGLKPVSPKPGEPNFDLAWTSDDRVWVAEVKSITDANEERQLRLGLGQVLRYANLLGKSATALPVLMAERPPTDGSWLSLCEALGVIVLWPERLADLTAVLLV